MLIYHNPKLASIRILRIKARRQEARVKIPAQRKNKKKERQKNATTKTIYQKKINILFSPSGEYSAQ